MLAHGAKRGRFDGVADRDDLWRLWVLATRRKVIDQTCNRQAIKRGGGMTETPLSAIVETSAATPDAIMAMQEKMHHLLVNFATTRFDKSLWTVWRDT